MTWGKLDDRFWRNRKVSRLARTDLGAVGLLALAISYASEHETDGLLTEADLEQILPWRPRRRRRLIRKLVAEGLLDQGQGRYRSEWREGERGMPPTIGYHDLPEGVYVIHDYLDFNRSRARRQKDNREGLQRVRKHRGRGGGQRGETRAA